MQDSLGDRMKGYEAAFRYVLSRRMPVIIRVDGKCFHGLTRHLRRPFCKEFSDAMIVVATELCNEIQGAVLAYTQSDEISILLHYYKTFDSEPWFDNQLQKMVSVSAGIASSQLTRLEHTFKPASYKPIVFDARAFCLPEADVCNYFLWRQNDASRNSVQMFA